MEVGLDGLAPAKKSAPKKEMKGEEKESKGEAKGEVKGLDEPTDDEVLLLVSQEGAKIPVAKKIAITSELVKTMSDGGNSHFLTFNEHTR